MESYCFVRFHVLRFEASTCAAAGTSASNNKHNGRWLRHITAEFPLHMLCMLWTSIDGKLTVNGGANVTRVFDIRTMQIERKWHRTFAKCKAYALRVICDEHSTRATAQRSNKSYGKWVAKHAWLSYFCTSRAIGKREHPIDICFRSLCCHWCDEHFCRSRNGAIYIESQPHN